MTPRPRIAETISIVLILFTLNPRGTHAAPAAKTVSIDRFLAGVSIPKEEDYEISDFTLGDHRVTDLFNVIPVNQADGHSDPPDTEMLLVKLRNSEAFAELRQKALFSKELQVDIIMGKRARRCRILGGLLAFQCSKRIEIPFTLDYTTPCEEVTRVFYVAMGEEMRENVRLVGDSPTPIPLDHIFSLLLTDKIVPFMRGLRPVDRNNQCFKEFGLLKWLRDEEMEGFDRSDYAMHQGLRDVLKGIAGTLAGMKWERYRFEIEVIGYADQSNFQKPRDLLRRDTGIGGWNQIRHPLAVYYRGCKGERLLGKSPVSIIFGEESTVPVGSKIDDNCELGATRAYVATVFLMDLLGTDNIEYKYGTGGILETDDRSLDYLNRRIKIRVVAKSAERRPSVRDIRLTD